MADGRIVYGACRSCGGTLFHAAELIDGSICETCSVEFERGREAERRRQEQERKRAQARSQARARADKTPEPTAPASRPSNATERDRTRTEVPANRRRERGKRIYRRADGTSFDYYVTNNTKTPRYILADGRGAVVKVNNRESYIKDGTLLGGDRDTLPTDYLKVRKRGARTYSHVEARAIGRSGNILSPAERERRKAKAADRAANARKNRTHRRRGGARGMTPEQIAQTVAKVAGRK